MPIAQETIRGFYRLTHNGPPLDPGCDGLILGLYSRDGGDTLADLCIQWDPIHATKDSGPKTRPSASIVVSDLCVSVLREFEDVLEWFAARQQGDDPVDLDGMVRHLLDIGVQDMLVRDPLNHRKAF